MTKLKLEVGKYYRTRDGRKVGLHINHRGGSGKWPFYHDCGDDSYHAVDQFGLSCIGCRGDDIIAEWTKTPTIGTLAEIGAQVGDVVKADGHGRALTVGAIDRQRDRPYFLRNVDGDRDWYAGTFDKWRIISRASDLSKLDYKTINVEKPIYEIVPDTRPLEHFQSGPVITETVKRIVPGVYGKVSVGNDGPNGGILVDLRCGITTRADLIAARDVFSALIDEMDP